MKTRLIYSNYDLSGEEELARAFLKEENPEEEPTEAAVWDEAIFQSQLTWEIEYSALCHFLDGNTLIAAGSIGRWDGSFPGGRVFYDFETLFTECTRDCDYWELTDENGHLYLKCSHHDGTNYFEIKIINDRAVNLISKWEYDYTDNRSEEEIHGIVFNNNLFSRLPHFAHNVFGVPKRQN